MRSFSPAGRRIIAACLPALICLCLAAGCEVERRKVEVRVVTATSMLAAIVGEVGGDRVTAAPLAPAEVLPERFELEPRHLDAIAEADLVVLSGWEEWASDASRAADGPGHVAITGIPGDLVLPYYHMDAADSITEILVRADPAGEVFYRYNHAAYRSRIDAEAEDMCARMSGLNGTRVICAEVQADFLDFLGFDIVGTYACGEDMSRVETDRLVEVGLRNEVALVVDDLHCGDGPGKRISEQMGVPRAVLARYPAGGSYPDLLRSNTGRILSALGVSR
jgi:hypothetical protein